MNPKRLRGLPLAGLSAGANNAPCRKFSCLCFRPAPRPLNAELGFERRGDQVVCFNGHLPAFTPRTEDVGSFRLFTTQLIVNGTATQGQIVKAFGVSITTVKRCCRLYRPRGAAAF